MKWYSVQLLKGDGLQLKQQGNNHETELLNPVNLCDQKGELVQSSIGWARKPLFNCNLTGRWPRKKKWNYWCTTNDKCLFSVTVSHLDYAGMVFIYFLDFQTKKYIEKTVMTPFGKGCTMPGNVGETVLFQHPSMEISMHREPYGTHMTVSCQDFNGLKLEADLQISFPEGHETLNVVIPWNQRTFQFTSKQNCLPTGGSLQVGDHTYSFSKKAAFSSLDFGRGIWPYQIPWNWATASGTVNHRAIGLNLGSKWTDGTGMTENAIVVDGRLTKIGEDVQFTFDINDIMKPWTIKSVRTDCVDLSFVPFYERIAKTNFLIVKSEMHQMVGHFSGHITTQTGERLTVAGLLGCAEDHFARW